MEAYIPDSDSRKQAVVEFFAKSGQQFLPIMELLIDAKQQLHDFAHGVGVAAIEGLLELSASKLAGMPHPGKAAPAPADSVHGTVRRHGHQKGVVVMGKSKFRVQRPRLRTLPDAAGRTLEVEPPAYAALKHDPKLAGRVMDVALGGGVSTRKYKKTLDQTADAVGISKSQVSRELKKAMTTALEQVQTRVIPGAEILAVFIDGFVVGSTHVIGAIGVKKDGTKMVLGVREGASENLTVVEALLVDLRDRGLTAEVPRLFILDGGKALRSAPWTRCMARTRRCSAVEIIRLGTCWITCPTSSVPMRSWSCVRPSIWRTPPRALRSYSSMPPTWNAAAGAVPRAPCARVWRSCSPCRPWACRGNCGGVWRPPTCWMPPTPARADSCGA